jgi:hypothetical protein
MKSVCIVGAGPAGLAAAKTFHQTGQFQITVYEQKQRLGGLWPSPDGDTKDDFLPLTTPTNLSRFTVGFSDLDWNSLNLPSDERVLMFPKAAQVNRYLDQYRRKYVPESCIKYGCEVVAAERIRKDDGSDKFSWHITTKGSQGDIKKEIFDYLVLASGFFSHPRPLKQKLPDLANGNHATKAVNEIHSSQFRTLSDLFSNGQSASGKTILAIGGGNSGGETSAAVAMQLSNSQWSPDTTLQQQYKDCKVVHVIPRQLYTLPPFHEYGEGSRSYTPLDLKLYDYARRQPWPMVSYAGQQPPEVRTLVHGMMKKLIGTDQSDLGSEALKAPKDTSERCAYVALTESYGEFARSGLIEAVKGRVTSTKNKPSGAATAIIQNGDETTILENVGAIIHATGYTPAPALDFLSADVKEALHYDPTSVRLPLILEQWQSANPAVPGIAFHGWYEGPYWPIIEIQARLTADRWLNDRWAPRKPYEEPGKLLELRDAMREQANDVPQFWFSDYTGYLEDVATHLGMEKNHGKFAEREGCPSPARYLGPSQDVEASKAIMDDLHQVWHDCLENGKYVPRAAFRALQGDWKISRKIESADPNFSGTLEGQASFHPRFPTKDNSGTRFDFEYLYIESGTFTPSSSAISMNASRRYVYRYSEARDELSVWFVKPSKDLEVDYLFHNLAFVKPEEARKEGALAARAEHLCVKDLYTTEYRLPMKGVTLLEFEVKHQVEGPEKNYRMGTRYWRRMIQP